MADGTPRFEDLPQRVFLDSSALQTLQDYGGFIYENEPVPEGDVIHRIPNGLVKLEALRAIFKVGERAPFEFALSRNSLAEVADRNDPLYLRWAFDVMDHWEVCASESGIPESGERIARKLGNGSFGYLSRKDKLLIQDAIVFGCDTFLTMERKLPRNGIHLERETGIRVHSPLSFWECLRPWASLFI